MEPRLPPNPFPGLRPYGPEEDHLFFGREKEIDELLRRLRFNRFLAIIGTSGCGKSSLVRSGLIPALQSGMMVRAGLSWRVALLRPGEDPIGHLADALDAPTALGQTTQADIGSPSSVLVETTLRRGSLGLTAAVRQARMEGQENLLVLVDQFEELFRFRRGRLGSNSRDESVAFVKLLLEATAQTEFPIYVVLTMRSDFIGDCMEFPGLPGAINQGLYLVPRMTRDELRSVVTGPVAVAGAEITPRLVVRVLNDLGDRQDELPLLQHALMRTWENWAETTPPDQPIDLPHYEAVGTLSQALSRHANEAYAEVGAGDGALVTERLFKALTDTFSDPRGIRRPTSIADLAAIGEVPESEAIRIVEIFRREGRSFLAPPEPVALHSATIIDISHESLMRTWDRLIKWADEERAAAALYLRLAQEARYFEQGVAGLWGDPELELGLRWRRENRPTLAWAQRYDDSFGRAMQFLDSSAAERERQRAERRTARVRRLVIAWGTAAVLLVAFLFAVAQGALAQRERDRAEMNLGIATGAVDQLLLATERSQGEVGADVPQMEHLRRELLESAQQFYSEFIEQQPDNESFREQMGFAHLRLGHIHRLLEDADRAADEYRAAIARFANLHEQQPGATQYAQALGNAWNWLGETLRPTAAKHAEAEQAYARAFDLQSDLVRVAPDEPVFRQELARTRYNRGILYANAPESLAVPIERAEQDFLEAVGLLEAVTERRTDRRATQELARAYNNLGALLAQDPSRTADARTFYERAIRTDEQLVAAEAGNREYQFELARYLNNYADLLLALEDVTPATQANDRALALLSDLARPAPSLGIEQADAHSLRGRILQSRSTQAATADYARAFELFVDLERSQQADRLPAFHQRFTDLLLNIASMSPRSGQADALLRKTVAYYVDLGLRTARAARPVGANSVLDNLLSVRDAMSPADRADTNGLLRTLQDVVRPESASR